MNPLPLVLLISISLGAATAAMLSPFFMGIGLAAAAPTAALFFVIGLWRDPDDPLIRNATAMLSMTVLGFAAVTIPMTLPVLDETSHEALNRFATMDEARAALVVRWVGFCSALPILGVGVGLVRMRAKR